MNDTGCALLYYTWNLFFDQIFVSLYALHLLRKVIRFLLDAHPVVYAVYRNYQSEGEGRI